MNETSITVVGPLNNGIIWEIKNFNDGNNTSLVINMDYAFLFSKKIDTITKLISILLS